MTPEVYFDNILGILLKELKGANTSIKVAMAWFTNKAIFDVIIERTRLKGVKVEIILNNDSINLNSEVKYETLYAHGGQVYFPFEEDYTMHNKFCIIDNIKVLNGSFNWTNKASYNKENLTIYSDTTFAKKFINEFEAIKTQCYSIENLLDKEEILSIKEEDSISLKNLILRSKNRKDIKNYISAIRDYIKIYEINNDPKFLFEIAECYTELNDLPKAIDIYSNLLKVQPEASEAFYQRGLLFLKTGSIKASLADYTKAINLNQNESKYYEGRGDAYQEVYRYVSKSSSLNLEYPMGYPTNPNLGSYFFGLTSDYKATPLLQTSLPWLKDYPDWKDFESTKNGFKAVGEKAITDYTQAIELNSKNTGLLYEKLTLLKHILSYDSEEQIKDRTNCINFFPNKAEHYYIRGICYEGKGIKDKAIEDYEKAVSLAPTQSTYAFTLNKLKSRVEIQGYTPRKERSSGFFDRLFK